MHARTLTAALEVQSFGRRVAGESVAEQAEPVEGDQGCDLELDARNVVLDLLEQRRRNLGGARAAAPRSAKEQTVSSRCIHAGFQMQDKAERSGEWSYGVGGGEVTSQM